MILRNTLMAATIAALGASAWAQGATPTDPLKKPAAPALTAPAPDKMPAKPAGAAALKHEKHAKATHKKHATKAPMKKDMNKAAPAAAHSS